MHSFPTRQEEVIDHLKEADEAEAKVEPEQAARLGDEGREGNGDVALVARVVGILDEDVDDGHVLGGVLVDEGGSATILFRIGIQWRADEIFARKNLRGCCRFVTNFFGNFW